jgi:hypothetical protein
MIAMMVSAVLVAVPPQPRAQNKAPIPFHASAVGVTVEETLTGVFSQDVPAGKRLLVRHVSLLAFGLDVTEELVLANCLISGTGLDTNGNVQDVSHFIPLTVSGNLATGRASVTGGGPLAMHLEAGPIRVTCSSGHDRQNLVSLEAHLSGELVSQ